MHLKKNLCIHKPVIRSVMQLHLHYGREFKACGNCGMGYLLQETCSLRQTITLLDSGSLRFANRIPGGVAHRELFV